MSQTTPETAVFALKDLFKQNGIDLPTPLAFEAVARVHGYTNWAEMYEKTADEREAHEEAERRQAAEAVKAEKREELLAKYYRRDGKQRSDTAIPVEDILTISGADELAVMNGGGYLAINCDGSVYYFDEEPVCFLGGAWLTPDSRDGSPCMRVEVLPHAAHLCLWKLDASGEIVGRVQQSAAAQSAPEASA